VAVCGKFAKRSDRSQDDTATCPVGRLPLRKDTETRTKPKNLSRSKYDYGMMTMIPEGWE